MKIAIIGSGPGGLSAGMLLAHKGMDVTIYERNSQVGGRCSTITSPDHDYVFDVGPTFLIMPFILEDIFWQCGLNLYDYVNLRLLEPFYQLSYHDGSRFYPGQNYERVKRNIEQLNTKDVPGLDSFMLDNQCKFHKAFPVLRGDYRKFTDLFSKEVLNLLPFMRPYKSLWNDLSRHFEDDQIKLGFTFQSKYLGMSPHSCPSLFTILSYIEYSMGVYHVMGGLNQLSKAMAQAFQELGGKLILNQDVQKVDIQNGRASGLLLSKSEGDQDTKGDQNNDIELEYYDEVIMNSDFAWGMKNLIDNDQRSKYTNKKLCNKNYSCSTFMLYLGLSTKYEHLLHHNIYISDDYQKNFADIEQGYLSEDPSLYIQNPSVTDPSLAPDGHSALYVLVSVPNNFADIDWSSYKENFRDNVISILKERAELEDLEDYIEFERIVTPEDWEEEFRVGFGACFNLAHNISQMLVFRPRNKFEEFDNMWLVGGGTNPGSGLPTIYESGRIVANGILSDYGYETPEPFLPPVVDYGSLQT